MESKKILPHKYSMDEKTTSKSTSIIPLPIPPSDSLAKEATTKQTKTPSDNKDNNNSKTLQIIHIVVASLILIILLVSFFRIPYFGSFIDSYIFELFFGTVKYLIYCLLITICINFILKLKLFSFFKKISPKVVIGSVLLFFFVMLTMAWLNQFCVSWPKFQPINGFFNFSKYFDAFTDYSKHYNDYSKFYNYYIPANPNDSQSTYYFNGGLIAEVVYAAVALFINKTMDEFLFIFIIVFFTPFLVEGILMLRKNIHKNGPGKEKTSFLSSAMRPDIGERHKVLKIGTKKINIEKATKKIPILPVLKTASVFLPVTKPVEENVLAVPETPNKKTKKIDTNDLKFPTKKVTKGVKANRTSEINELKAPVNYSIIAPNSDVKDETEVEYDANYNFALTIVQKINALIKKENLNITFISIFTMPLYSRIKYEGIDAAEVEKFLDYKKELKGIVDLDRFFLTFKENVAHFEVTNPIPLKISIHAINDTKDLLFLGVDDNRRPLALDEDVYSLGIYGKAGSGTSMLLSNIIASYSQNYDLTMANYSILSCEKNVKTIGAIYSDVNILKSHIYIGLDNVCKQIERLLASDLNKHTFIVIEDYNLLVEHNISWKPKLIALIQKVNAARGKIIISAKAIDEDSGSLEILTALSSYVGFWVSSEQESYMLINSDQASKLHGNGDGFLLVQNNDKIRFQSCYMNATELKLIFDELNKKYLV